MRRKKKRRKQQRRKNEKEKTKRDNVRTWKATRITVSSKKNDTYLTKEWTFKKGGTKRSFKGLQETKEAEPKRPNGRDKSGNE
jgi:hypothetical protein